MIGDFVTRERDRLTSGGGDLVSSPDRCLPSPVATTSSLPALNRLRAISILDGERGIPSDFLPATLFAIVLPFKFSRGKNSWMRRPAAAALAASAAGTFAKNDACKNHAGGGVPGGRRRRSVARSVGPLPNFRRHCQPGCLALSCARGSSSSRNGASSADSRIAKFASRHGPGGGSGAGQRERGDGADGQGEGEREAG